MRDTKIFRSLRQIFLCLLLIILFSLYCFGYAMDTPNKTVHQHITNESLLIWKNLPYEIKIHGTRPIISQVNGDFNLGIDDIISGSGEEDRRLDTILAAFTNHFWQPDDPDTLTSGRGDYDDGLFLGGSSFVKAKEIWLMNVIPNYLSGNINESYYHLGRVAHLIEDAAQPSHVHLDPHFGHQGILCGGSNADCDDSFLEGYTADNLLTLQNTYNWSGENFENKSYKYSMVV